MRKYLTPEKKCIDCEEVFKVRSPRHKRCDECAKEEVKRNARAYAKNHSERTRENKRKWYHANKERLKKLSTSSKKNT